jgi:hypothetical protein
MTNVATMQKREMIASLMKTFSVRDYTITGMSEFFSSHDESRPVTAFLNHGSMVSWAAVLPCIIQTATKLIPEYSFGSNYHKLLRAMPVLGNVAGAIGGLESNLETVDDTVEHLEKHPKIVMGTMPEGSNCSFDFKSIIAPFSQFGLIKASILSNSDVLLIVHKGTEAWDRNVIPLIGKRKAVKVPIGFKRCDLTIDFNRFNIDVTRSEYESLNKKQRKECLRDVGEDMRQAMLDVHNRL